MTDQTSNLSSIVQSAISIESAAQRDEFLDRSSDGNRSLRGRLQMILDSLPESRVAAARAHQSTHRQSKTDQSVIKSLSAAIPQTPRVLLNNAADAAPGPVVQPTSTEIPSLGSDSRYQIQGEIARGGMGAILKGRDTDLGRSLAVKVLLEQHKDNELAIQRFIEEAQIGGQLQHPGIAPVYELGRFEDQRPFFTMKLVNGETLAWLLVSRRSPQQDRAKLLSTFHQVCQTMAYAHSRRVIHRDLKPANVMVGSFGEVQVMDWGLAKVLPKEGAPIEKPKSPDPLKGQSIIQTLRSADGSIDSADTQMGSAMGTPAYMPPEQAVGDVDQMDRRADVFGLGAILCEILTGEAPYVADTTRDIIRMAAQAKLDPCYDRLDQCGADEDLIVLTKRCLSVDAADRPVDAGTLAEELGEYLQSVEQKLHQAKIESAEQAARFVEERKRRRVALALAASILLMVGLGGTAWMQVQAEQRKQIAAATERFDEALNEANLHVGMTEDQSLAVQQAELTKAAINAEQAVKLSEQDGIDGERAAKATKLLALIQQQSADVQEQITRQTRDERMQDRLELIRLGHADGSDDINIADEQANLDTEHTVEQYKAAFGEYGLDVEKLSETEVADVIKKSAIGEVLIAALDHWAKELSTSQSAGEQDHVQPLAPDRGLCARLLSIANASDESQWRRELRSALVAGDLDMLNELVTAPETANQSPVLIAWLGATLRQAKQYDAAVSVLRPTQEQYPADFWVTHELGKCLNLQEKNDEAIGFLRAALAIRPKSVVAAWSLVATLDDAGKSDESELLFQQMLESSDMTSEEYAWLADSLYRGGRYAQCEAAIEKALELDDRNAKAYQVQVRVESRREEYDKALTAAKKAVDVAPSDYWSYFRLGRAYEGLGDLEQAEAAYDKAITLNPPRPTAHYNLATVLRQLDRPEKAVQMYREARKILPDYYLAIAGLRELLLQMRKEATEDQALAIDNEIAQLPRQVETLEMGIDELRQKLELNRRDAETRHALASKLHSLGHREEAIKEWETVVEGDPNHFGAHFRLARAFGAFGPSNGNSNDRDRAVEHLRKTLELAQEDANDSRPLFARLALATKLHQRALGDYEFRSGEQHGGLASEELLAQIRSNMSPQQVADLDEAITHYRAHQKLLAEKKRVRPSRAELLARQRLVAALRLKGELEEVARLVEKGTSKLTTVLSQELQTFATEVQRLSRSGKSDEVIELLQQALTEEWEKKERRFLRHFLAMALRKERQYAKAAELYRANMEEFPELPNPPINLAQALLDDGQVDEALQAIKKTDLQDTPVWKIYHRIGQAYAEAGELDKALIALRKADIKNTIYLGFHRDIALIQYEKGEFDEAISEMRRALDGTYVAPRYQGELAWLLLLIKDEDGKLIHLDEAAKCAEIARRTATKNLSNPKMDSPLNAAIFTPLGMVNYRQGNWKEALADLQISHDHKYEGFDKLVFLAMTHWQLGNKEEAGKWYEQASAYKNDHYLNRAEREYFEEASHLIDR